MSITKEMGVSTFQNAGKYFGIVKGTTTSGIRISNVAGYYFLDNCPEFIIYSGCRCRLKDSGGKYLDVVLGARGVSEGLSDIITESFDNWTSDNPDGWLVSESGSNPAIHQVGTGESNTGAGTGSCNFYTTSAYLAIMSQVPAMSTSAKKLYKLTLTLSFVGSGALTDPNSAYYTFTSSGSKYFTMLTNEQLSLKRLGATNITVDDLLLQQVTSPSSNGILFTGTEETGFTYNQSTYTYEIWSN